MTVRSFILLGQYGFGKGMLALQQPLSYFGDVSIHEWYDNSPIFTIGRLPALTKIFITGFSLGANELGWIGQHSERIIDLGIGYDPSRKSPLVRRINGEYLQVCPRYRQLVCYYNPGTWWYGGARYDAGEIIRINQTHLSVPNNEALHNTTITYVKRLAEG